MVYFVNVEFLVELFFFLYYINVYDVLIYLICYILKINMMKL